MLGDETGKNTKSQYANIVHSVNHSLKTGGKLILAINNRLGIQYWTGKTDRCSPTIFARIENACENAEEYSFSKKVMIEILRECGFSKMFFYYPSPDYIYSQNIFSDNYCPRIGDVRPVTNHFERENYQVFDENKAMDAFCEEELFDQFANSFLIIAEK